MPFQNERGRLGEGRENAAGDELLPGEAAFLTPRRLFRGSLCPAYECGAKVEALQSLRDVAEGVRVVLYGHGAVYEVESEPVYGRHFSEPAAHEVFLNRAVHVLEMEEGSRKACSARHGLRAQIEAFQSLCDVSECARVMLHGHCAVYEIEGELVHERHFPEPAAHEVFLNRAVHVFEVKEGNCEIRRLRHDLGAEIETLKSLRDVGEGRGSVTYGDRALNEVESEAVHGWHLSKLVPDEILFHGAVHFGNAEVCQRFPVFVFRDFLTAAAGVVEVKRLQG